MVRGQKKSLNGIELFLCPFENLYITQGPNEAPSHKGIMAWDVSGTPQESYFAPATSKCLKIYYDSGQSMWQTIGNVRCPNGYVGIVTYMIVHDNDISDLYVGKIVNQGERLGEFGTKGNVTGSHCHIEFSQGSDTTWKALGTFVMNGKTYTTYGFNNEKDPEEVCFMDNTNIISGYGNWRYTDSLFIGNPVERSLDVDQVEVFTDKFYPTGRKEPMGYISGFVKGGFYNILETREQNNLTWVKVADDLWFDLGNEWAKVLPKGNATEEMVKIKELESKIKLLEDRILELTEERDTLLNNQPTLIYTAPKDITGRIKLKKDEQLYIKKN